MKTIIKFLISISLYEQLLIILFIPLLARGQFLGLMQDDTKSYKSLGYTVEAGSRYAPVSGTTNIAGSGTGREIITIHNQFRIRQTGYINSIKIYSGTVPNSIFYLKVWRKDGSTYDLISQSQDLRTQFTANAVQTLTINPSIYAAEGDYVGFYVGNSVDLLASSLTGANLYYYNGTASTNDFAWESQSVLSNKAMKFIVYMESPSFVFIGNSIIAGHPSHYSFLESTATTDIASTISYNTVLGSNYNYQNMGIGSQTTANILARFKADVIDLRPKHVILEGGVNDVSLTVPTSTIMSNYTAMFDSLKNNNINASVLLIFGWQGGTAAQNRRIDSINTQIKTLTESYTNINYIDARSAVNEFRVGGDAGNLWDIIDIYDADHIHFNALGYAKIGEIIRKKLGIK